MDTKVHFDGRNIVRERVQDVEPILQRNALLRSMEQRSDWGRHIASIPAVICEHWYNEEYTRGNTSLRMFSKEWDELVAKKLRDPTWKWLRTDSPAAQGFLGFGS